MHKKSEDLVILILDEDDNTTPEGKFLKEDEIPKRYRGRLHLS